MANELPVLPDIRFIETDPQQIIKDIISGYEAMAGYQLADGDPRRLFLLSIAYIIIQQRQQIDASGKSNLLYYAEGDYLDQLGLFRRVTRIPAQAAVTTLRFTLSAPRATNVGIPQGTRATADNQIFWRTTQPATITAGQLFVDVAAEAMTAGSAANDLPDGTITRLVDPIPYVQSVTNTVITSNGRDTEADDSYRIRIYQAPVGFSIAGPEEAYVFWARSASSTIVDVRAYSPSSGVVEVRPLLENGGIPTQALLDLVDATLSDKTIRPLTDNVQVLAPDVVNYDIELTYFIRSQDIASESDIQQRVQSAIDSYVVWQYSKLGRDINPQELISRILQAGAKRATLVSPSFQVLSESEVAIVGAVNATYGGIEDD